MSWFVFSSDVECLYPLSEICLVCTMKVHLWTVPSCVPHSGLKNGLVKADFWNLVAFNLGPNFSCHVCSYGWVSEVREIASEMLYGAGCQKAQFVPAMVGPFLKMTLVRESELRKATLPIFFDMMDCEQAARGNFQQVYTIMTLDLPPAVGLFVSLVGSRDYRPREMADDEYPLIRINPALYTNCLKGALARICNTGNYTTLHCLSILLFRQSASRFLSWYPLSLLTNMRRRFSALRATTSPLLWQKL